jgi:hypothetical protein
MLLIEITESKVVNTNIALNKLTFKHMLVDVQLFYD